MAPFMPFHFSLFFFALLFCHSSSQYLKLPLLHTSPYPPPPPAALSADKLRLYALHNRRAVHPQLPVSSAASCGAGQYLVSIHLGTPPQRISLVADTGSDLTWVSCSACRGRSRCPPRAGYFMPHRSSTSSPYHCFNAACRLIPEPKKPPHCNRTRIHRACRYEYTYSDGSITNGFFSHETTAFNTSVGRLLQFRRLSFGCGFWNSGPKVSGPSFNGANGVLGLGRGPISFASQLGNEYRTQVLVLFTGLQPRPPPTSYLLIGGGSQIGVVGKGKFSYMPLLINPLSPTFYYIGIEDVLINDMKL